MKLPRRQFLHLVAGATRIMGDDGFGRIHHAGEFVNRSIGGHRAHAQFTRQLAQSETIRPLFGKQTGRRLAQAIAKTLDF